MKLKLKLLLIIIFLGQVNIVANQQKRINWFNELSELTFDVYSTNGAGEDECKKRRIVNFLVELYFSVDKKAFNDLFYCSFTKSGCPGCLTIDILEGCGLFTKNKPDPGIKRSFELCSKIICDYNADHKRTGSRIFPTCDNILAIMAFGMVTFADLEITAQAAAKKRQTLNAMELSLLMKLAPKLGEWKTLEEFLDSISLYYRAFKAIKIVLENCEENSIDLEIHICG